MNLTFPISAGEISSEHTQRPSLPVAFSRVCVCVCVCVCLSVCMCVFSCCSGLSRVPFLELLVGGAPGAEAFSSPWVSLLPCLQGPGELPNRFLRLCWLPKVQPRISDHLVFGSLRICIFPQIPRWFCAAEPGAGLGEPLTKFLILHTYRASLVWCPRSRV